MRFSLPSSVLAIAASVAAEEIHLANCYVGFGAWHESEVLYYSGAVDHSNWPPSSNSCNPTNDLKVITWEGQTINCKFTTGVSVSIQIDADAQSKANFAQVGFLTQSGGKRFNCFKDDQRSIFSIGEDGTKNAGSGCSSIYYCLP